MALIFWRGTDETTDTAVTEGHALPVQVLDGVHLKPSAIRTFEASLSVGTAAVQLTPGSPHDTAVITVEIAPVRVRLDGAAPTASVGHLLYVGDTITLDNYTEIAAARFIAVSSTATLMVSYGKRAG